MKRSYSYIVDVVIQEEPSRDRGDSRVQQILSDFEKRVKKIALKDEGTTLKVSDISISPKSREMVLPDGQQIFKEESDRNAVRRYLKRFR